MSPGSSVSQIPPYGTQYVNPPMPPPGQYQQDQRRPSNPVYMPPQNIQPVMMMQPQIIAAPPSGMVRKRTVRRIPLTPQGFELN